MAKILIIDDNQYIRASVKEILELEGHETLSAPSGHLGIQLAKEHLPDLVICDILMPGLTGYDVLITLRKDPLTMAIPFIFLTSKKARKDFRKGMSLGADDYLTKPFQLDELLSSIETRLEKRAAISKQMDDLRLNLSLTLPHELRTPLCAILGFSEFLLFLGPERLPDPKQVIEIQTSIYDSALRLQRVIENYLLYANLRLMEYEPERKKQERWQCDDSLQIKRFLTEFIKYHAERAGRLEDLVFDLIDAEIHVSTRSLQKIAEEILDNALKFSEPGTPVRIETKISDDQLLLSITDQGRGMSAEQIAQIGAYVQFDRKRYEQQGAGLGLVIAQLLVSLSGGTLTIESELRKGTTVTLAFSQSSV